MYNKFKIINKDIYNLEIEKTKLKLKTLVYKLTSFGYDEQSLSELKNKISDKWKYLIEEKKDDKNIDKDREKNKIENDIINNKEDNNNINNIKEKITKEEVEYMCKLMNKKVYRKYFLIQINNFRTLGVYKIPLEIFNYIKQIFIEISKYLIIENNNENNKIIIDTEIGKIIIILSQTFYYMNDDGQKDYIQKEIKNEKIFHMKEFWTQVIKTYIEIELKTVEENEKMYNNKETDEIIKNRRNNIAFAQIVPYVGGMAGFGLNKDEIKNIVLPLIDEYGISNENKDIIFGLIENEN